MIPLALGSDFLAHPRTAIVASNATPPIIKPGFTFSVIVFPPPYSCIPNAFQLVTELLDTLGGANAKKSFVCSVRHSSSTSVGGRRVIQQRCVQFYRIGSIVPDTREWQVRIYRQIGPGGHPAAIRQRRAFRKLFGT